MKTPAYSPCASYRFQFNSQFAFEDAIKLADYLARLGVTDCYASPLFTARTKSAHGYDVCDFNAINPEMGGAEGFERLSHELKERGLGLILDIVPNHMGIGEPGNRWWMSVLELGLGSPFARIFDIQWRSNDPALDGKLLLPVLGDRFGAVLERGELQVKFSEGAFFIAYFDKAFPMSPESVDELLRMASAECGGSAVDDLKALADAYRALAETLRAKSEDRLDPSAPDPFATIKARLSRLHSTSDDPRRALDAALARINGVPSDPRSYEALGKLISQQNYRLAFWRVGPVELNYRRFFDITDLMSTRVEDPQVFEAVHRMVDRYVREGKVQGLRVDHPDGLWDPAQYFRRVQSMAMAGAGIGEEEVRAQIDTLVKRQTGSAPDWPLYVVAEKILSPGEELPMDWAVHGTTGYDYLNLVNGLFVDQVHEKKFDVFYREFSGIDGPFEEIVHRSKGLILEKSLISEVSALARKFRWIALRTRHGCDYLEAELREALVEALVCFPVYRSYLTEESSQTSAQDKRFIVEAIEEASQRRPELKAVFGLLEKTMLFELLADSPSKMHWPIKEFVMRFQQLSGPAMAKGLEDTTFYRYFRFISLNEVGGAPEHFGVSLDEFHQANRARAGQWPESMLTTATHDTKRGEDVRARLNVLSEMPDEWGEAVTGWSEMNRAFKKRKAGREMPDANDEYLLYQTLVGAWPGRVESGEALDDFKERVGAYMLKAIKESKRHTTWTEPDDEYEAAIKEFVDRALDPGNPFIESLRTFHEEIAYFGIYNSLAQTLIKVMSPGMPDTYQGCEFIDLSLVDPDNRRPVDYQRRAATLRELDKAAPEGGEISDFARKLIESGDDDRAKMFVLSRALRFRKAHRELFRRGAYLPLQVTGEKAKHVVAFARRSGEQSCIVIAPRLVRTLMSGGKAPPLGEQAWGSTAVTLPDELTAGKWRNVITGEEVGAMQSDNGLVLKLSLCLAHFPAALLIPANQ